MRCSLIGGPSRPVILALRACVAALVSLALVGCKEDPASEWTLVLQSDRSQLTEDGTDSAMITVSVLDQNFNPPPIGSEVTLLAIPGGNVNDTGLAVGRSLTDALGFAQFTASCVDGQGMTLRAQFDDGVGILLPPVGGTSSIACTEAPRGDWSIAITAEPRRIAPGGSTTVSLVALDGDGNPVTTTPNVLLEVTSGPLVFTRGGITLQRSADASGRLDVTVVAPTTATDETSSVCASFVDQRFGSSAACVGIVVSSTPVTDASCIISYSATRSPADGTSETNATFTVSDAAGIPVQNATVEATLSAGLFLDGAGGAVIGPEYSGATNLNGDAATFIRSPIVPASAAITATATFDEAGAVRTIPCTARTDLTFFGPPQCSFEGITPDQLGVRDSGLDEQGLATFCFVQSDGAPVGAGQRVDFSFDLEFPEAGLSASTALTDSNGCANIYVRAGTQAGTAVIRATLDFGSQDSTCASAPLLFRGGLPFGNNFVLTCDETDLSVLPSRNGDVIESFCDVRCTATLRDKFGNPVDRPDIRVFFATEQGSVINAVTPDSNGVAVTTYRPRGTMPFDVPPLDNEPRLIESLSGRVVNPRDTWVTITAFTTGEEGYFDADGDGTYDPEEAWIDQGEPFVDSDDDDQYDPGAPVFERFFDVETPDRDFNGEWDGPNGEYDAVTTIWTSTVVRLTGAPVLGPVTNHGFVRDAAAGPLSPPLFSYFRGYDGSIRGQGFDRVRADPGETVAVAFYAVDSFLNAVTWKNSVLGLEGFDCAALDVSDFSTVPQNLGRELNGYRFGGGRTETDADLFLWETVYTPPYLGSGTASFASTVFNVIGAESVSLVTPPGEDAEYDCIGSASVDAKAAEACDENVVRLWTVSLED
jgi:hypothetical protein